jgi:hypothetical protein
MMLTVTPPCACRAVNLAYGACFGELATCSIRCRFLDRVEAAREAKQLSCWEKTQPAE